MATLVYEGKDGSLVRKRITLPRGVPVEVPDEAAEALSHRDDVRVVDDVDPDAVPDGNVPQVIDWIGDDVDRARLVLDSGETRKGIVVAHAAAVIEASESDDDDEGDTAGDQDDEGAESESDAAGDDSE